MNYKINILLVLFINLVSISFLAFSEDAKEQEFDYGPTELTILYAGSERVYNRAELALAKWNRRTNKQLEMCKVIAVSLTRLNDEENDSEYRLLYAARDKKCIYGLFSKFAHKCIKILKAKIRDSGYLSTFVLKDSKDYKKFVNVKKLKCYFDM